MQRKQYVMAGKVSMRKFYSGEGVCASSSPYLLLSLDAGSTLWSSAPAIRRFVPLWTEKADPLRTAHVVPVRGGSSLDLSLFPCLNDKKCQTKRWLASLHKPWSRTFWILWTCRRSRPSRSIHTSAWVPALFLRKETERVWERQWMLVFLQNKTFCD